MVGGGAGVEGEGVRSSGVSKPRSGVGVGSGKREDHLPGSQLPREQRAFFRRRGCRWSFGWGRWSTLSLGRERHV